MIACTLHANADETLKQPHSAAAVSTNNTLKNDHTQTLHVPKFIFIQNLFNQIIGYEQFLKNQTVCVLTNCKVPQLKYQHSQSCA